MPKVNPAITVVKLPNNSNGCREKGDNSLSIAIIRHSWEKDVKFVADELDSIPKIVNY